MLSSRLHVRGIRPSVPYKGPPLAKHILQRTIRHPRQDHRLHSILPEGIDNYLTTGTVIASAVAILGSAALAARQAPDVRQRKTDEADISQYAIMSVVSFIPLFNWMAWVLPALQSPDRATLYYSFAALYMAPLLRTGFDLDSYAWIMLVLGIVHVQVERIAQTEPEVLREIHPLMTVAKAVGWVTLKTAGFLGNLLKIVASDSKDIVTRGGSKQHKDDDDDDDQHGTGLGAGGAAGGRGVLPPGTGERDVEQRIELKQFDRMMLERDKKRQIQQGKGVREGQQRVQKGDDGGW